MGNEQGHIEETLQNRYMVSDGIEQWMRERK